VVRRVTDKEAGGATSLEPKKGIIWTYFFHIFFGCLQTHSCPCCTKRTKKTTVKAGRKKAKTADEPHASPTTPRTRAVVAREAAVRARLEAEQAQEKAIAAQQAAEQASRAAIIEVPHDPPPTMVQLPPPATQPGPNTRRYNMYSQLYVC